MEKLDRAQKLPPTAHALPKSTIFNNSNFAKYFVRKYLNYIMPSFLDSSLIWENVLVL